MTSPVFQLGAATVTSKERSSEMLMSTCRLCCWPWHMMKVMFLACPTPTLLKPDCSGVPQMPGCGGFVVIPDSQVMHVSSPRESTLAHLIIPEEGPVYKATANPIDKLPSLHGELSLCLQIAHRESAFVGRNQFLQNSVGSCGFLRKSAVFCSFLRLPNPF